MLCVGFLRFRRRGTDAVDKWSDLVARLVEEGSTIGRDGAGKRASRHVDER